MNINLNNPLSLMDETVSTLLRAEYERQRDTLSMIASENYTSQAVMQVVGSIFANKYAEGYPGKRYYYGCEIMDKIESLAIERTCAVFGCKYANVQPHSGSQANQAVMLAFMSPGDNFLGMNLSAGGHLTHGHPVNVSGKWFRAQHYGVNEQGLIDLDQVRDLAKKHRPKMIIAGASSYSRIFDFAAFRSIADEVNSMLWADVAHYAGLIAAKAYPDPVPHAHVCTFTTHKTLRGPRGAIITCNDAELATKINRAVFPGLQGGPFMNNIAARAVMLQECQQSSFIKYARDTVKYARFLAKQLMQNNIPVLSAGTDSHIIMINLIPLKLRGDLVASSFSNAGIIVNQNAVPNDPHPPSITSGVRLGTAACVTRGFGDKEFSKINNWIISLIQHLQHSSQRNFVLEQNIKKQVGQLLQDFPLYENFA